MEKLDLKRKYSSLYSPSASKVSEVDVPAFQFAMIDGRGDPAASEFQGAVEALYTLTYTIKFWSKQHEVPADWQEFGVAPLEGRWWVEGVDSPFAADAPREDWRWTAMILLPHFITGELVAQAQAAAAIKKPEVDTSHVRLERLEEGRSVQIMHIGPYSNELPTILKLDAYMAEHDLISNGQHHEIYLGDPRRTEPTKLKTVLRHPVRERNN